MGALNLYRFVANHPLTRDHRASAIGRIMRWQLASRVGLGPIAVPFVNDARLLVSRGMRGATGNVYAGLHEFVDMAFLLHFLRSDDLFVDVGANVGTYTVLASKVVGGRTVALEPVSTTFASLLDNINLNGISSSVRPVRAAVGKEAGTVQMTTQRGPTNHVANLAAGDRDEEAEAAPMVCLNDLLHDEGTPALLKIDVEGFESEVLDGGHEVLQNPGVKAVLIETNGSGERYGTSDDDNHNRLTALGFQRSDYDPFKRELRPLHSSDSQIGNSLYIRDCEVVSRRIAESPPFEVLGRRV